MSPSKRRANVREACDTLAAELGVLRTQVREVGEAYLTNLEAEIVQIRSDVASMAEDMGDDGAVCRMIDEIRGLRIKPGKGRMKDLKRIDTLIDRLEEILREIE